MTSKRVSGDNLQHCLCLRFHLCLGKHQSRYKFKSMAMALIFSSKTDTALGLEHRKELPSKPCSLFLQFPSCDDYGSPENWIVYKAWWGNKASMVKGDISNVAGVNSFNAIHPVRLSLELHHSLIINSSLTLLVVVRENYLSVSYQRSAPRQKSTCEEPSWSVPFASTEVPEVSRVSYLPTQRSPSSKWRLSVWLTWRLWKWLTSIA